MTTTGSIDNLLHNIGYRKIHHLNYFPKMTNSPHLCTAHGETVGQV